MVSSNPVQAFVSRPYDIIIFGATGFTGSLVAEYFLKTYPSDTFKWAIAGRDIKKLESTWEKIKKKVNVGSDNGEFKQNNGEVSILQANSNDLESLKSLAKSTKVILTTVGPYTKYGKKLVEACCETGTHYCDLTGECTWVKDMLNLYEEKAQESGANIVNMAGFDSEPSDLGTLMMYNHMENNGITPKSITFQLAESIGGVSGGTIHSAAAVVTEVMKNGRYKDMSNTNLLVTERSSPDQKDLKTVSPVSIRPQYSVGYDNVLKRYTAPFFMADVNTRVVARTGHLKAYKPFTYSEVMSFNGNLLGLAQAFLVTVFSGLLVFFFTVPPLRWFLLKMVPPGTGPSEEIMKTGFGQVYYVAKGEKESKEVQCIGSCYIQGDPGYSATAKMLAETAVCLAKKEPVHGKGGFLTPATCCGTELIERLCDKGGFKFSVNP